MQAKESLLRLPEVEAIVGLKKSKLYHLIKVGNFPPPVRLGKRSVRWKSSVIHSWIESLTAQPEEVAS